MTLDRFIVAVTCVLAAVASGVNVWAALRGPVALRPMNAARAGLAAVYTAAYIWLLINPDKRLAWSHTMTGVSLAAWVLVWITPAAIAIRLQRDIARQVGNG